MGGWVLGGATFARPPTSKSEGTSGEAATVSAMDKELHDEYERLGLKKLRKNPTARPGDADPDHAHFRAELDLACKDAECCPCTKHACADAEIKLWSHGKVQRFRAFEKQTEHDLLKYGVAPVLLLRVQLGAACMFLVLGLLSIAAIVENVGAWQEDGVSAENLGWANTSEFYLMTTLGWHLSSVSPDAVRAQNWITVAQFFVVLLFLMWARLEMRVKSKEADELDSTASDYTVMIQGLPRLEDAAALKAELTKWFADNFAEGKTGEVTVEVAVECSDVVDLLYKRKAAFIGLAEAEARVRGETSTATTEGEAKARTALEAIDQELSTAWAKPRRVSGTAFVSFEHAKQRNDCATTFQDPEWKELLELLIDMFFLQCTKRIVMKLVRHFDKKSNNKTLELTKCIKDHLKKAQKAAAEAAKASGEGEAAGTKWYLGKRLDELLYVDVTDAPEPEDVLWQNLEVSESKTIARQAISIAGILLLLAASAWIMTAIKANVDSLTKTLNDCMTNPEDECEWEGLVEFSKSWVGTNATKKAFQSLSLIQTVVLQLLNMVIRATAFYTVKLERKHTHSVREKSIFFKMAFAYLVNSVLLLMIVNHENTSTWYKPGSVLEQALTFLVFDVAVNSILRLQQWVVEPLMRLYGRLTSKSQARLQEWYAPKKLELGELYASMVLTFGLCMFYGPMAPIAYAFGAVTMLINHFFCRFSMVHLHRVPPRMSDELCEGLRQVLGLLLIGHTCIAMYFYLNSCYGGCEFGAVGTPLVIAIVVFAVYLLAPWRRGSWFQRYRSVTRIVEVATKAVEAATEAVDEAVQKVEHALGADEGRADAAKPNEASGANGIQVRRYSSLIVGARRGDDDGHRGALHVSYDVPVLSRYDGDGSDHVFKQQKFLRYDFCPEILREPHCQPRSDRCCALIARGRKLSAQV